MPEEKHRSQVFISYSRRDLDFVETLAADLKAASLDVWYDLSGLEGGSRWSREIEKAIRESQYVLVVLSPDSVVSKWVEEEFLFASELNKKIIPLFHKQCSIPFGYRTLHFIDVQGNKYKRNFGEILRAMGVKPVAPKKPSVTVQEESSAVKPEEKPKVVPKPKPEKTKLKINMRAIAGLFGLAVIVIAGVFGFPYVADVFSSQPEATATVTRTPRPFNATEAAFISKVAPTQAPQTATTSALLTQLAIGNTQIAVETQLPTEITDANGVSMIFVSEGNFIAGEKGAESDVFLPAFYIDKYEVTNSEYSRCVLSGDCQLPSDTVLATYDYYGNAEYDDYPVVWVNITMAKDYCSWRDARLPSELEWEKAARGTDGRIYPWGNTINSTIRANGHGNKDGYEIASPVGSFPEGVSPYGVYDMAGNVWEWTSAITSFGGSWVYGDLFVYDYYDIGGGSRFDVGFRCAKDTTP